MFISRFCHFLLPSALLLAPLFAAASGMQPETSVVILEEAQGEALITVHNSDDTPALLLTTLQNMPQDNAELIQISPPAIRVDGGKKQTVRFLLTSTEPLKTERLRRVIFEGVAPKRKGESRVRMTVAQNIPLIVRPAGLPRNNAPWKQLKWHWQSGQLSVSNPSPYVVRLSQMVQTRPDNQRWLLPQTYVLPGETLQLTGESSASSTTPQQVRLFPASSWGFSVDRWDAPLSH